MIPIATPASLLIYEGSTATGALVTQLAKISGYYVLATYLAHNFNLVTRLGADAVFDYSDPISAAKIREYTKNSLKLMFDTFSLERSATYCTQALSTEGGDYSTFLSIKMARENVKSGATMAYTAFGVPFKFGDQDIPAKLKNKVSWRSFVLLLRGCWPMERSEFIRPSWAAVG